MASPFPSVEPSSTTMTSNSVYVCARTLIRAACTCRARLKVGMTTDIKGLWLIRWILRLSYGSHAHLQTEQGGWEEYPTSNWVSSSFKPSDCASRVSFRLRGPFNSYEGWY